MKAILSAMSLTQPSQTHVVEDIRPLADYLLAQQQQYRPLQDQYETYFCYETRELRLPGGSTALIVPKVSAVPPTASQDRQIAMPADHVGIAKFETPEDAGFRLLVDSLKASMKGAFGRSEHRWDAFNRQ
jgi:hypothetical protein